MPLSLSLSLCLGEPRSKKTTKQLGAPSEASLIKAFNPPLSPPPRPGPTSRGLEDHLPVPPQLAGSRLQARRAGQDLVPWRMRNGMEWNGMGHADMGV